METETTHYFRQLPLFKGLPEQQLSELASRMQVRQFSRNEEVVRQGSPATSVFIVQSGMLAVTRISPVTGEKHSLAYLKEGDLLGEIELLSGPNSLATATATALTQAVLLEISSADFLNLLQMENSVALELARVLAKRLRATTERLGNDDGMANRVCLVIGNGRGAGVTTIGTAMSLTLNASTQSATAYTEYPDSSRLADLFDILPGLQRYPQAGGFEIVMPDADANTQAGLQASIFFDQLILAYPNLVIGLTGELDASLDYLLERTDQIVIVTSPDPSDAEPLGALTARLKQLLHADRTSLYIVSNRPGPEHSGVPTPPYADFDVPYLDDLPAPAQATTGNLPTAISEVVSTLVDRLKRTNQVRVYIPTTVDVDQQLDTSTYVKEALALLGNLFGGATSDSAQGVWKSENAGLVGETVYIVTSYVTQSDLDRHLEHILAVVDRMKYELKQEAMALEVNERLMLI
ncbi:MAG: family transcriptional regulator, cyclic receptor protein [Chloroflexia bacterium]|nr:family transcriptional regulator, cyclic receptor protein [Chloroflexia bacterium]